ncbi:hypothetical protein A0H81_02490 [Grifola frondosa]|uniref:F-box domain-containing protein n=1 Tax=Grifola frondosa TaxID=5627 RepID=A0A1C7MM58_GRIFR|nr:hypothetical protein A0H81_02490 [Grifola frondosa]
MLMYSASSTIAVHALHLTHVFFAESNDFFRLVAAFPRLTDLSLTAVYWTRLSSQPSSSICLPWGNNSVILHKLDVSTDFTSTVLEWLTRSSFKLRPHFLFLKWTHKPKDNAVLRYILREAGTSLRTLRLCGEYDTFHGQMISSTSSTADSLLSCNTQLHALFLYHALCDFTKLSGDVTSTSALPWISFVLSRLNSTSLRQLDIIFTTDTVVDRIVAWGWAELDDVLSHLVTKVPELIISIYLESFLGGQAVSRSGGVQAHKGVSAQDKNETQNETRSSAPEV